MDEAPKYRAALDRLQALSGAASVVPPNGADAPRRDGVRAGGKQPGRLARERHHVTTLLAANPALDAVWWLDPASGDWIGDAPAVPAARRPTIVIGRGTGLLLVASDGFRLAMP